MITFVNLMCKGNTISPTTQFVGAEFTKEGECIDAWLIIKAHNNSPKEERIRIRNKEL